MSFQFFKNNVTKSILIIHCSFLFYKKQCEKLNRRKIQWENSLRNGPVVVGRVRQGAIRTTYVPKKQWQWWWLWGMWLLQVTVVYEGAWRLGSIFDRVHSCHGSRGIIHIDCRVKSDRSWESARPRPFVVSAVLLHVNGDTWYTGDW